MRHIKMFLMMLIQGGVWFIGLWAGLVLYTHMTIYIAARITVELALIVLALLAIAMIYSQIRVLMIRIVSKIRGIYLYFDR